MDNGCNSNETRCDKIRLALYTNRRDVVICQVVEFFENMSGTIIPKCFWLNSLFLKNWFAMTPMMSSNEAASFGIFQQSLLFPNERINSNHGRYDIFMGISKEKLN